MWKPCTRRPAVRHRSPAADSGAAVRHSPSAADTEAPRPTQTCQFRHTDLTLLSQRWDLFPSLSGSPARAAPRSDTEAPRPTQVPPSDTAPPRPTRYTWRRPPRHLAPADTALGAGRHGTWRRPTRTPSRGRHAHPAGRLTAADTDLVHFRSHTRVPIQRSC